MKIDEMREQVKQYDEAVKARDAAHSLLGALRNGEGCGSAIQKMLEHVLGTAVAPRLPVVIRNSLAASLWKAAVNLKQEAEDNLKKIGESD